MVSKIVLYLTCSFSLGMFQLSYVKQQIVFANISAQETCPFVIWNKNVQSRRTVSVKITSYRVSLVLNCLLVLNLLNFSILKRAGSRDLTDKSRELNSPEKR